MVLVPLSLVHAALLFRPACRRIRTLLLRVLTLRLRARLLLVRRLLLREGDLLLVRRTLQVLGWTVLLGLGGALLVVAELLLGWRTARLMLRGEVLLRGRNLLRVRNRLLASRLRIRLLLTWIVRRMRVLRLERSVLLLRVLLRILRVLIVGDGALALEGILLRGCAVRGLVHGRRSLLDETRVGRLRSSKLVVHRAEVLCTTSEPWQASEKDRPCFWLYFSMSLVT